MLFRCLIAFHLIFFSFGLAGQSLFFFADAMVNTDEAKHRRYAASQFEPLFMKELQDPSSFAHPFDELKWLVTAYPPDSSFRTISWQIDLGDGRFAHRGLIQTETGDLFPYSKSGGDQAKGIKLQLAWTEWEGGLIYNIVGIDSSTYTLLTFRQTDEYTKLKTAEVLYFQEGVPMLGKPLFQDKEEGDDFHHRLVLQYSSDSNVSLNYHPQSGQLVYDHLIQVVGRLPGQGPTMVSDGSYKAFFLDEGRWTAIDKLYNEVLVTPPRRNAGEDKDLFGRTKKNGG